MIALILGAIAGATQPVVYIPSLDFDFTDNAYIPPAGTAVNFDYV
jgi:hypothetical protein